MTDAQVPWLTTEEMQVWRTMLRVQTELSAALGRAMQASSGLSLQDYETLVHLSEAEQGSLRVSALADQMHWERSRLSHHLRRMEQRGLVAKRECQEDARGAFVELTEEGRAALDGAAPDHVRAVRQYFLDPIGEDLEVTGRTLGRVLSRCEGEPLAHRAG